MAKITGIAIGTVVVLSMLAPCSAFYQEPFPCGAATGHLGTLMYTNSEASGGPGVPAVYLTNEPGGGFGIAGVSFYDGMDNLHDRRIASVYGGGWISRKRWSLTLSTRFHDALGV